MTHTLYWFRNDLRLEDNPALTRALTQASQVTTVFVHPDDAPTAWGFERVGPHRKTWLRCSLDALQNDLARMGVQLLEVRGNPARVLPELMRKVNADQLGFESLAAPEEQQAETALRQTGVPVVSTWQTTLIHPEQLPFSVRALPGSFTPFRQALEKHRIEPSQPIKYPRHAQKPEPGLFMAPPALPLDQHKKDNAPQPETTQQAITLHDHTPTAGERGAQAHLQAWFSGTQAHEYKRTRNALDGWSSSTKFSVWLATGALSARAAAHALHVFEQREGRSESSGWILFELLWRDYFHFLHACHGRRLYAPSGLKGRAQPAHDPEAFERWRMGRTGHALIDAGMNELRHTGYLSNRMRQIVASYCIHDLGCDWRAGAAWFEHCLIDYDVCSNTGNWLYIAGLGTDPRGGRRFNPDKQADEYDRDGRYRQRWSAV